MDTEKDYIIVDARTQWEFDEDHIEGAILIQEYEIAKRAERKFPTKTRLFLSIAVVVGAVRLPRKNL